MRAALLRRGGSFLLPRSSGYNAGVKLPIWALALVGLGLDAAVTVRLFNSAGLQIGFDSFTLADDADISLASRLDGDGAANVDADWRTEATDCIIQTDQKIGIGAWYNFAGDAVASSGEIEIIPGMWQVGGSGIHPYLQIGRSLDYAQYGGKWYKVETAKAEVAQSQTGSDIVAAAAGFKYVVLAALAVCGGVATALTFVSDGASDTEISPTIENGANGGLVAAFEGYTLFETLADEALSATTGAGATTAVLVKYLKVPA